MPDYPFRPSAHYLFMCPGAHKAEKALPRPSSKWAERGTALHKAIATALLFGADDITTVAPTELRADAETLNIGQMALDAMSAIAAQCSTFEVEKHLAIGAAIGVEYAALFGGTTDFLGYDEAKKTIHAADTKTGGDLISPMTIQLRGYGVGAAAEYPDYEHMHLHVVQPLAKAQGVEITQTAVFTRREMEEQRRWFKDCIDAALAENPERSPGVWCKRCPALALCRPAAEFHLGVVAAAQQAGSPETLEPVVISQVVWRADAVSEFLTAARQHATDVLMKGGKLPQLKLTRPSVPRSFPAARSAEVIRALADAGADLDVVAPRSLVSAAALERLGYGEIAKAFATKGVGTYRAVHRDVRAKEVPPPGAEAKALDELESSLSFEI